MKFKNLIYTFIFTIIAVGCHKAVNEPEQATQYQNKTADLKAGIIGTNYYVAKTGSDNNSGSSSSPFLTIQKAANVVNPGDVVIVRDGTYSNTVPNYSSEKAILIINRSGTSTSWITFKSENLGGAVLDGLNFATQHGIMMNASYVCIEGFEIKNILFWAVSAWPASSNTVFKNNYIHDIGNVCSTNTNGFSAFNLMGNSNTVIESNKIKNIGRLSPNEGCTSAGTVYQWNDHGIYIAGCSNIIMRSNIFIDCDNGWAIHLYSGANTSSSNISILNNTFYARTQRSHGHIILSCPITTINIINNLFIMSANADVIGFSATENLAVHIPVQFAPYITGGIIKYNMMYQGNGIIARNFSQISMSNNIVNTNPLVRDLANNDFYLQSTSPAINTGIYVGLTSDYSGNAIVGLPDIGAYEYAGSNPTQTSYYNLGATTTADKNDCGTGYAGSKVTYSVEPGKYTSTSSQDDADAKATADLTANKQAYANANGTCIINNATTKFYSAAIILDS